MTPPPELRNPAEVRCTAAPLPRGESVQTRGGGRSYLRSIRRGWHRYLDVLLGAVLLTAGILKGWQLLTDPSVGRAAGFPREVLLAATAFELAFGSWLLAGLYRHLTRWIALAWFTSLAAVALAQAVGGAPSCACLGTIHTNPWLMFAFDVVAVVALGLWSPHDYSSPRHLLTVLCLSLLPAAGLLGFASLFVHEPLFVEIDLGAIAQGGQKQQAFQVVNTSGALVEVATVATSCPCARIQLERSDISTGQLLVGNVSMDLRSKPDFVGNLTVEAKGVRRRGRVAFVLLIRARVYAASSADKGTL